MAARDEKLGKDLGSERVMHPSLEHEDQTRDSERARVHFPPCRRVDMSSRPKIRFFYSHLITGEERSEGRKALGSEEERGRS